MKYILEENYVENAETVIKNLKVKKDSKGRVTQMVSMSKLRNILSMTADIYNDVLNLQEDKIPSQIRSKIEYLKIRIIYECGREQGVKDLIEEAHIIEALKTFEGRKTEFILFNRYMEALVAFHRYYGGKD